MSKIIHHDLFMRFLINGSSAVLIALIIFLASFSVASWIYVLAVACVSAIALWEYYNIVKKKEGTPAFKVGITFSCLYIVSVFLKATSPFFSFLPQVLLGLAFLLCFVPYVFSGKNPIFNIATSFFGLLYIAIPLGLFVTILFFFKDERLSHFEGSWWVIYLIAVTKSADMGGYFIGRKFGKHKIAIRISPKKTVEGFFGGLIASILISLLICFLGKKIGDVFEHFSYITSLILGFFVGLIGQMGDLAESLFKRDALVKDSNTLPGVGGVLDMVDSLLFTAPVVYTFLRIFYDYYN